MPHRKVALVSIVFALCFLPNGGAIAAALRTFVSGGGIDTNPCTLTLPCRSFAAAIAQTLTTGQTHGAGEVIVLDSAGYGPVTITQSVSIIAPPGVYAGITVASSIPSVNGVTIDGVGSIVVLRGLTITGQSNSIASGIYFTQGSRLTVENCEISGFPISGIYVDSADTRVIIRDSVLRENGSFGFSALASVTATLDRVRVENNDIGGVLGSNGAHIAVTDSVLANNVTFGVNAYAKDGTTTNITVTHTTIVGSIVGFMVSASPGGTAITVADANAISDVTSAAFYFTGLGGTESIYSSGTNTVGPNFVPTLGGSLTPIGQY